MWQTLTIQHVKKYLEKSEATIKGQMKQARKDVRSTRPKAKPTEQHKEERYEKHLTNCTNVVYATIQELEGHIYIDLMEGFPKKRQPKGIRTYWCCMIMMGIIFKQNQ
jgi:hypothetical protein